jgi:hypothetical protein
MTRREWAEGLKAGDPVAVRYDFNSGVRLAKVERTTKTTIIVDGTRYWRKNGDAVGYSYSSPVLEEPTDAVRREVAIRQARKALRDAEWGKLTDEAVLTLAAALAVAERKPGL